MMSLKKVNAIDQNGFFLKKTQYNTDKPGLENKVKEAGKKIPSTIGLIKKTDKLPFITGLATTAALIAVENKKSNVINLVKKQIMM